jgi:hypothetical protein
MNYELRMIKFFSMLIKSSAIEYLKLYFELILIHKFEINDIIRDDWSISTLSKVSKI